MAKTVIVGGVAGGATAAARLRRLDENAEIVMFERDEHISFANCGLPYHISGIIPQRSNLLLQTPESFNTRFNVDVRIFSEVISINPDSKTVSVKNIKANETYEEVYDNLIIATGSMPIKPPIAGLDFEGVFTLRNVANMDRIIEFIENKNPKSAVVIGGGYIGVETAENLAHRGLEVSIVELSDQLIAPIDFDMAADVHQYLRAKGISLYLKNGVNAIEQAENGFCAKLTNGEINADLVIVAVGVLPDTAIAKNAGIKVNARGGIFVNEKMLTNIENIYAVGDAVVVTNYVSGEQGLIPLAGPANKQARIAADNICGRNSVYDNTLGSSILKVFDMTVAATGINEKTAKRLNINYDKVYTLLAGHASYYPNTAPMQIKVLFEKETGKILGAQIVGFDGVDKRCDIFATCIKLGATASDLTRLELCYAPPFGSAKDPVNMIGYMIENVSNGVVKQYHWDDVANLPKDGSVTLLDVRTDAEYGAGAIEGTVHIPVDELRRRIDELNNAKPVYVNCRSGLRSYIACRILSQRGFDCYNLAGGYRFYEAVIKELV